MRAERKSHEEQLRLIQECRASGLTDAQWCKQHDIHPGTFYRWIAQARARGCDDIPERSTAAVPVCNEVVRVDAGFREVMPEFRPTERAGGLHPSKERPITVLEIYCSNEYFSPLFDYFHRELLKRRFLMADETRVQVLHEPDRKPETDSYMWLFRSGEDGLPPIILYHYTETRAKFNAQSFLDGFSGYLETDGYQGYNNLPGVKRCCCYAHLRRYFYDAIPSGKKYDLSEPAVQAVQYLDKLFAHERVCKTNGYTPEQRHKYRLQNEKPILDHFWNWVEKQQPVQNTRFEKAVTYARNQRQYFMTYLEDGRCIISNN